MRKELEDKRVRILIYMNSMFSDVSEKDGVVWNMYEDGIKNDHFIKHNDGKLF